MQTLQFNDLEQFLVCGSSKSSRNTAKYFDHVVYCEVKNKAHKFSSSTTATNNVLTGSRLDIALENSAEPSLLDIFSGKAKSTQATAAETPGQRAIKNLQNFSKKP